LIVKKQFGLTPKLQLKRAEQLADAGAALRISTTDAAPASANTFIESADLASKDDMGSFQFWPR
jgi:hypothetical protein